MNDRLSSSRRCSPLNGVTGGTRRRAKRHPSARSTIVVAAAMGFMSASHFARADEWNNPAGGSWHTGSNWQDGTTPTASDWAYFQNDVMLNGTVSFTGNAASQGLTMKNTSGTTTFDVGSGNTWTQSLYTIMGDGSSPAVQKPSLTLTSGSISSVLLLIGNNSLTEAHVTITGPTSIYTTSSNMAVGSDSGSNSTLTISNGGRAISNGTGALGVQTAQNCKITITDPGSKMTVASGFSIGGGIDPAVDAGHHTLEILNGGEMSTGRVLVGVGGMFAVAPGNTINVSGTNSKLTLTSVNGVSVSTRAASIGFNNSDNTLNVDNNGQVVSTNGDIRVGDNPTSVNNLVHLNSGTITMAGVGNLTTAGTGIMDVRRGKLWVESGTATLPGLLANQGSTSELQLDGGTAIINNANVVNATPLLIGNGAGTTMTYRMNSSAGKHTFADGLTVQSDGRLEGAATIVGNVTNNGIMATGPSAGTLRIVGTLTVNAGAKTDLSNNPMIVTGTPAGTWTGSGYTDITGLVRSGKGSGNSWNGSTGIITTQTGAIGSNLTTIGVALASDVRPSMGTNTALWAGQTITGTDTLVMYTYGGDANLDGKLNIDDYVRIDAGIAAGLTGWCNGDFNYDGKINIDDYTTMIDANIGVQGAPFPTGSGVSDVTAVPEPASMMTFLAASAGAAIIRGRRRRCR